MSNEDKKFIQYNVNNLPKKSRQEVLDFIYMLDPDGTQECASGTLINLDLIGDEKINDLKSLIKYKLENG
jgi:hypothetical protein